MTAEGELDTPKVDSNVPNGTAEGKMESSGDGDPAGAKSESVTTSAAMRIAELERKYVELLEIKVSFLEKELSSKKGDSKDESEDKKPETERNEKSEEKKEKDTDSSSGDDDKKEVPRILYKESRYNDSGMEVEVEVSSEDAKDASKKKKNVSAMKMTRKYDEDKKYKRSVLTCYDPNLVTLLLFGLAHHPEVKHYKFTEETFFFSPFSLIVHNWDLFQDLASLDDSKSIVKELHEGIKRVSSSKPDAHQPNCLVGLRHLSNTEVLDTAIKDLRIFLKEVENYPGLDFVFNKENDVSKDEEDGDQPTEADQKTSIFFERLWTLFSPGDLVVSQVFMKQPQVFLVFDSNPGNITHKDGTSYWNLLCWTYDWDGTQFQRQLVKFSFEKFKELKQITLLPCYPLEYHRDKEQLRTDLIERGKKYCQYALEKASSRIFEYEGQVVSHGKGFRNVGNDDDSDDDDSHLRFTRTNNKRQVIKDRVMVDFKAYLEHGPPNHGDAPMGDAVFVTLNYEDRCLCESCETNHRLKDNQKLYFDGQKDSSTFEDLQYLMLPPRVLGYHLSGKEWVELDVNKVKNIDNKIDDSGFKGLEMKKSTKELIRDLVRNHSSVNDRTPLMQDLAKGKGNGLVILLHGPPGVGKTLTAESVALATGKPLFAVSVSDIGLNPAEVESNLNILFELASEWQAVMLFDEADVFLESRSNNTADLRRNALVSVLLRSLEYFSGILILTTNRIRTLDVALQSRINFAIRYQDLTDEQKRKIYKSFISQLTDDNANKEELLSWIDEDENKEESPFKKLNGRQIRNVLFSAASLAAGKNGRGILEMKHVQKILDQTLKFQDDVNAIMENARKEAEIGFKPL